MLDKVDKMLLNDKWFCQQLVEIGNIGHEKERLVEEKYPIEVL